MTQVSFSDLLDTLQRGADGEPEAGDLSTTPSGSFTPVRSGADDDAVVVFSVKHQFYLVLVALGVLICLSGNIIIYSHVCPLDM